MKKITVLFTLFVIFLTVITSCASQGKPSSSSYLLKSYGAPTSLTEEIDDMTGEKKITSSGVVLYNAKIGWNNTCMWHVVRGESEKRYRTIFKANMPGWLFIDTVYMKIGNDVIKFSKTDKTLTNDQQTVDQGNVEEYVACYMDRTTFERVITAEQLSISIRGSRGKLDYQVPLNKDWQVLLKY